ncbi:NUDIX hydrolase [Peribacillus sp. FSL H8-0477]|uniref:NUDIX hydrolase n=1 Tax=Peribacillus sp. FSL H8-0477 TaxID=2921388 RepID=UPI0030F4E09B
MKKVIVAYAFIYNEAEEKVLIVNNVGAGWTLPGGEVEDGENIKQAVIREVKEETGLTVEAGHIVAVNEAVITARGNQPLFITFRGRISGGELGVQNKTEISEVKWVEIEAANQFIPYHPGGVLNLLEGSVPYLFRKQ